MAESYGITQLASLDVEPLFVSARDTEMMAVEITLGYPLAYHSRGALLAKKTSDGKYYDYVPGSGDGTETLAGILAEDMQSLGADQSTHMIVSGDINRAACASVTTIPTGLQIYNNLNFVEVN